MIPPMSFEGVIAPYPVQRDRPFWTKYGYATAWQFGHVPARYLSNFGLRLYQLYLAFFKYIEIPYHWHMTFHSEGGTTYYRAYDMAWNAGVSTDSDWFKALCCTGFLPLVTRVHSSDEHGTIAAINVNIIVSLHGYHSPPVPGFLADYYKENFT